MKFQLRILLYLFFCFSAEVLGWFLGNSCSSRITCGDCIAAGPECAWCSGEDFPDEEKPRCDFLKNLHGNCDYEDIVFPAYKMSIIKNLKISRSGGKAVKAVQIKPQEVKLTLRSKSPFPLGFEFSQTEDFPVDLYYLMDLSGSMTDHKDKLNELGNKLAEEMSKITSNFRLGFGSFVNNAMPNTSFLIAKLEDQDSNWVAPYGFRNHMGLSMDTANFSRRINETRVSGKADVLEGGSDAVIQAIVCRQEIGWRQKSKKILVFSSGNGFHYAGDGKLGGIAEPNDGNCHLDYGGFYTNTYHQDYPSVSQINHKIQEKKVNIIFAVTADQVPVYKRLSNLLVGSTTVELENDPCVIHLVKDQYEKITSEVEIRDSAYSHIQVTYYSTCLGSEKKKTNICEGLKVGNSVIFEANIEVTSCPKDPKDWIKTFRIYPAGIRDALTVNLEIICECNCEKPWNEERNSVKCSHGRGTYKCGICSCNSNQFGRKCECSAEDIYHDAVDKCSCGDDTVQCSGRGYCICGRCQCIKRPNPKEKVFGTFCECDNYSCDRSEGNICSGPDHGVCECGICICLPGWNGPNCGCQDSNHTCIAPNGKICSGHGDCECGFCKCFDMEEDRYSGRFCERCLTCPLKCEAYRDCVECQMFPDDNNVPQKKCSNCTFVPIRVDEIKVEEEDDETLCIFRDDKDCRFTFKYKHDEEDQLIVYAENKTCIN